MSENVYNRLSIETTDESKKTDVGEPANVQGSHAVVSESKDREKAARFKRLAEARTNKALKAIRLIGNLTGANYQSTEEQRHAISDALKDATDEMYDKLHRTYKNETSSFSL